MTPTRPGRRRGRRTLRWLMVLAVAVLAVMVGSGPARARSVSGPNITPCTNPDFFQCLSTTTTAPTTVPPQTAPPTTAPVPTTTPSTTPSSSTTVPSVPSSGSTSAAFVPCGTITGTCNTPPEQVEVAYPAASIPPGLQLAWVKSSAGSAPQPSTSPVTLDPRNAVPCNRQARAATGDATECWPWPAGLQDKGVILNGTYQLTPDGAKAESLGLAVPPAAPRQVVATAVTDSVNISWQPSANPEPDLTGYVLTRNGQPVYYCSTDGLGQGAATPCSKPLQVTDHPGAGKWTYAVSALRLGVDDAAADVVPSSAVAAAPGPVNVAGLPAGTGPAPAPLSSIGLAPLPSAVGTYSDGTGSVSAAAPTPVGGDAAPAPETAPVQNLKYSGSDSPVVGKPSDLALKVGEPGPRTDVVPVAVLALGIIALAIAAHFLYLRVELSLAEARLAGRRRPGVRATRPRL